jgi:tripartite-type tricarboxylate transporter receptor subunit TctC
MDYVLWFAVLVPNRTPVAIIKKLREGIATASDDPDYKQQLHARGFEAASNAPEQLAAFLQQDFQKFKVLIEKLDLKID